MRILTGRKAAPTPGSFEAAAGAGEREEFATFDAVRRDVPPGSIFARSPGGPLFLALGNSASWVSVPVDSGVVAVDEDGSANVRVMGMANLVVTYLPPAQHRKVTLAQLKDGDLFARGDEEAGAFRAFLGPLSPDGRIAALRLDAPYATRYTVSRNPETEVTVIGSFVYDARS